MKNENIIAEKSKGFAVRIVKLCQALQEDRREYVLSRQLMKSGTSIGANVREAGRGQTRADFYTKLTIALKEADETSYWLELLKEGDCLDEAAFETVYAECQELIRLLTAITKTIRNKNATTEKM